jgi:hypothetical protein
MKEKIRYKENRKIELYITGGVLVVDQNTIDELTKGYNKKLLESDYKNILNYELHEQGYLTQGQELKLIR